MSKMIFVNLPVRDLAASTAFYVALGGAVNPQFSDDQATSLMLSEAIGVMLLTRDRYRQFTARPIGDARRESQALLALTVDSRDAVDTTLTRTHRGRRSSRSESGAGSRLHVQPQRRGSRRQCLGDRVDEPRRARPYIRKRLIGAFSSEKRASAMPSASRQAGADRAMPNRNGKAAQTAAFRPSAALFRRTAAMHKAC